MSQLAESHHWSASGSWQRTWRNILLLQRSLCQTVWTLNWLLILLTATTTQKTVELSSGWRMPINTDCWLYLPRSCCQRLHLRHMWNVCSQSAESREQAKEIGWLKALRRESCWSWAWNSMHDFSQPISLLKTWLIFDVHQHCNTSVVTSDSVFYFHTLMQILCRKVKPIWIY